MSALNSWAAACLLAGLLTIGGCGGDSSQGRPDLPTATPGADTSGQPIKNHITGSVGDGPLVDAQVVVRSSSGARLKKLRSNATADYGLAVKTRDNNYPLSIEADGGTDLVTGAPPDFKLVSAVLEPASRTISNLNPFTTLIYGAAQRHDSGINAVSVAAARAAVMTNYAFGLDAAIIPDPTATRIDAGNVHHVVKAGETLGEMIRRTRDAMAAAGSNLDGDAIVAILSADLVDGHIDGYGAPGSDERVAAVANVASAAVLIEAMANQLHVYGVDATEAMDLAIRQVNPTAPATSGTADVGITAAAIAQAERSLQAAALVASDPRIDAAIAVTASASPGLLPADFAARLPDDIVATMTTAALATARADETQLAAVNATARGVAIPPPGWATVSWKAPTTRTDESPIDKINNYTVYFGRTRAALDRTVKIGGGQTRYRINNLDPGTWYFAVTATSNGVESAKSNIVRKTIS